MPNLRLEARKAAQRNGLDPDVFERQIQQESGFRADAVSPKGARGVAQIMPDTARAWGVNPMDPIAALNASARNMAGYVRKYGGIENALRAYNAGPGAIEASRNYRETNNYVRTILGGRTPARTESDPQSPEDPETRSRT
jgi:soluble lytic murein transglycosylase-like protein